MTSWENELNDERCKPQNPKPSGLGTVTGGAQVFAQLRLLRVTMGGIKWSQYCRAFG